MTSIPETNILPPSEKPIRLPSASTEETFHISEKTHSDTLLLDSTTAKRREVMTRASLSQELPADSKTIPLPSADTEETFHLSEKGHSETLLLDCTTAKRREVMTRKSLAQELPAGETPIPLPSKTCEEKFHTNNQTPLLLSGN
mmetsp:Transcript_15353/g.42514  ORF Transcript_15353/g.42514 Transcript_15353/m.42514 type:complete len:144 (-) Transcript_15353:2274-2705(-)|eukprot:CAMPEP_0168787856 /NCGR_PEP_ID=MMETSP0725-20121227/12022_1 /TAXON_ID=265536 /ORGANISM="Amphiprora sp., Strain CCMP467" /LENGTH=143 /DNA_ID=CAMNT_0008838087 /DNA_START=20 /DNA_END=451 /DNA_ORIENTATION=-